MPFFKTGFHAVYYIGTMPRFVKAKTWFFGIILYISNYIFTLCIEEMIRRLSSCRSCPVNTKIYYVLISREQRHNKKKVSNMFYNLFSSSSKLNLSAIYKATILILSVNLRKGTHKKAFF